MEDVPHIQKYPAPDAKLIEIDGAAGLAPVCNDVRVETGYVVETKLPAPSDAQPTVIQIAGL